MRVILLNGGPRSGKDTLADQIEWAGRAANIVVFRTSIGRELKTVTNAVYAWLQGFAPPTWDAWEDHKDEPNDYFQGRTPRECWIAVHEMLKSLHGPSLLVDRIVRQIQFLTNTDVLLVTDIGNNDEANAFRRFPSTVVRVHREGTKWDNRSHVTDEGRLFEVLDWTSETEIPKIRHWIRKHLLQYMVA